MNISKFLLVLMFIGCMAVDALAIPANPNPYHWVQPDGTVVTVTQWGDEFMNGYLSEDGYLLAIDGEGWMCYAQQLNNVWVASTQKANDVDKRTFSEKLFVQKLQKENPKAVYRRSLDQKRIKTLSLGGETTYPTIGKRRALAVLVDFPNTAGDNAVKFTYPKERFVEMMTKENFDFEGATGSVRDYFLASSNGQFDINFDVYGPVTMSKDISFYGKNTPQGDIYAWNMVVEACQALDDEIDFSKYDLDLDGFVDNIYVFYAGEGEATGGQPYTVWPHAADIERLKPVTQDSYVFDGVKLNHYACSNELRTRYDEDSKKRITTLEGIGTVCHEFTHVLGFPDLYNTKDQTASFTPGPWSIMDVGSHNNNSHTPPTFSSYERLCMGWLEPRELTGPANVVLSDISKNQACIVKTSNEGEFFLFENRQKEGWDAFIPGHGMLVWHIEYQKDMWDANQVNTQNQLINLVEADGTESELSRADDAFPGGQNVTSFTDDTHPSMKTNGGVNTNIPISDILERSGLITFKVCGGKASIESVEALPATEVTPVSFIANWSKSKEEGATYRLNVYSKSGKGKIFVEGFQGASVDENSCLVSGLKAETTYYYEVKAVASNGEESDYSATVTVKTGRMSFAYSSPVVSEATQVTTSSFLANWNELAAAETYDISVYTQAKGVADTLTLGFDNGLEFPIGWKTNCKMVISADGYFGESAPSLSMAADYAYIETPILNKSVRGLSFWYRERNRPGGENSLIISGMINNEWVALDTVPLSNEKNIEGRVISWSDLDEKMDIFPSSCKAVRISLRKDGKRDVAIDDIRIAYDNKYYPVYLPEWQDRPVGAVTSYEVNGLQKDSQYFYVVRGVKGSERSLYSSAMSVWTFEPGTGIVTPTEDNETAIVVRSYGNYADIENLPLPDDSDVCVYNMNGIMVAKTAVVDGKVSFYVAASGVYVVATAKGTYKVML